MIARKEDHMYDKDLDKDDIETGVPYVVSVRLRGVADLLLHRWNP
jgi:hypothetical protein